MALPTLNYSTPEEFVDYYYNKLKQDLEVFDIKISKVGFLGFMLNILGYTHFDLKTYYDGLFKEAFLATAQDDESLYLHSSIYGYIPGFATAATATGNLEFDFSTMLPPIRSDIIKREVYLGYYDPEYDGLVTTTGSPERIPATFKYDNYNFTIDSTYKFVEEVINPDSTPKTYKYYVEIITDDGQVINYPSNTAVISVPLFSTKQYIKKETTISIPNYNFGSYYSIYITVEEGTYLSDLEVYISNTDPEPTIENRYDVQYIKYLFRSDDKVVFLRKITPNIFMLEFGSGIRGNLVSGKNALIISKYTYGSKGNLINSNSATIKLDSNGSYTEYEYKSSSINPEMGYLVESINVDFDHSDGGVDILSNEELRDAIVNYVQTRDNLLSERDFYNIAAKYDFLTDFKFLFKKYLVYDNIFYLCRSFRKRDQNVCFTTNYTTPILNINDKPEVTLEEDSTSGSLVIGETYSYRVIACDEWGKSIPSDEEAITLSAQTSVKIKWTEIFQAKYYRIYGRTTSSESIYWDVAAPANFYIDDGSQLSPTVLDSSTSGTLIPGNTYVYRLVSYDSNGISTMSDETSIVLGSGKTSIEISWTPTSGIVRYRVYGRVSGVQNMYWDILVTEDPLPISLSYVDTGIDGISGFPDFLPTQSSMSDLVFMPRFVIDGHDFISPFIYKGNSRMGYFDSYLMENVLLVRFANVIVSSTDLIRQNISAPSVYLNLVYDNIGRKTIIKLKSFQDISPSSNFKFYIRNTIVNSINLPIDGVMVYNGTDPTDLYWGYEYTNINTFGILEDEIQLSIECEFYTTSTTPPSWIQAFTYETDNFYQIYNISDQLRLLKYISGSTYYKTNIPVIDYDVYSSEPDYYINKLYNFFYSILFQENRMITDNVQGRFLNTFFIESPYIEAVFNGGGRILSDLDWQNDVLSVRNEPPIYLSNGNRYLISMIPTVGDAFEGHENEIAQYDASGLTWSFTQPVDNMVVYVVEDKRSYYYKDITSTSELTIPSPSELPSTIILEVSAGHNYLIDQNITILYDIDNWMNGNIVMIDGNNLSIFINYISGSGTYSSWSVSPWGNLPNINFPLKLKVNVIADKDYTTRYNINTLTVKDDLNVELADFLQKERTGVNIEFYNSQIVDIVHNNRPFIKSVTVEVTDSSATPLNLNNGIEVLKDNDILESLPDKLSIVKYVPSFIYWDIDSIYDNINIIVV